MRLNHLIAALLCLLPLATAQAAQWTFDRGWPAAQGSNVARPQSPDGPAASVTIGDTPFPAPGAPPPEPRHANGGTEFVYTDPRGELVDRFEPFPALAPDARLRTLVYTNRSDRTQDLTGASLRIVQTAEPDGPSWSPPWFRMGTLADGGILCLAYRGSTDYYRFESGPGWLGHRVDACWRLAPGQQAAIGAQVVWTGDTSPDGFRVEARRWFDAVGLKVPADAPDWLCDAILYECSAGGHIDSRFSDTGGFDNFARQSEYLAGLGITAVWLQAVHAHKSPPDPVRGGWNLYDPLDVLAVDPILGGPDALKRLTERLRGCGLHVLGELVPHGGHSVQAQALEPWWTRGRDGRPTRNWGGYAMDYASPAWQGVMRDAAARLARDFGFEGARVDVADGSGPNWGSPRTHHASYSTLAGSVELLRAIRDGFGPGAKPLIIPENANYLEHLAVTPVAYGHSTWMLMARDLPGMKSDPAAMVARLRDFFETERGAYPPGSRVIRTLNNHDSVCEAGRVDYRYGAGLARALYGVCLMVEGIPMMYQEEEVGSYDALRALNGARRRVPEFARGEPDYLAVDFAPEAFACLRSTADAHALGLSNLSGTAVRGRVALPARLGLNDGTRAYDAVSGAEAEIRAGGFDWTLEPYATALLRLGQPPLEGPARAHEPDAAQPAAALEQTASGLRVDCGEMTLDLAPGPWELREETPEFARYESAHGTLRVAPLDRGWRVELRLKASAPAPELFVRHADRWQVSGQTALLSDRVLRRHFPFPDEANYAWDRSMEWMGAPLYNDVAPTGRLWQSLLEPLHPERPALAFSAGGVALVLSKIESNARNVVLTDRTDEPQPEPYGLALRFHGDDPDLHPRVRVLGLGQPWEMEEYPPASARDQELRFELVSMPLTETPAALQATRLPVDRGEAKVTVEGSNVHRDPHGWWFIEPGKVEWTRLAGVPGRYRIRLELRHSERSAEGTDLDDAYEVRVNGEVVALEWAQRATFHTGNAWFGYALTPPVDLAAVTAVSVAGLRPWCALRAPLHLQPE